jgi:hypothetical protein
MHDSLSGFYSHNNVSEASGEFGPIRRPGSVSFHSDRSQTFCTECQQIVTGLTPAEAADAFNTDLQDIGFLLRKEEIHMIRRDPTAISISICRDSIEWCFESRQTRLLNSHFEIAVQSTMGGQRE